ncbi:TolC family protein [Pandoraea sp. ISTKB]|uniref:TolC family protein n=1 Tax=Pandoraea sp. ISTKB TaxID=1586708 RepID=UPI001F0A435D|nr:TolC family protein [Pandoraea sp. ISTKB]
MKRTHPSVLAAQAQYEAANAKVSQTRREGLPNVSLVAKYSRNNQPASLGLRVPRPQLKHRDKPAHKPPPAPLAMPAPNPPARPLATAC